LKQSLIPLYIESSVDKRLDRPSPSSSSQNRVLSLFCSEYYGSAKTRDKGLPAGRLRFPCLWFAWPNRFERLSITTTNPVIPLLLRPWARFMSPVQARRCKNMLARNDNCQPYREADQPCKRGHGKKKCDTCATVEAKQFSKGKLCSLSVALCQRHYDRLGHSNPTTNNDTAEQKVCCISSLIYISKA